MIDSLEHHYQSLVSDGTDPLAASSTVKPYPTNSPILFRDLTQQERCEPLIAFTKVASRAPSHPHKRLTPETGCGHCINWVRSYSYEILLLIIPAVYMRKGCEAFGKREIIANAALIICPCFDRFPRSTSTKLVNPNDLRNTSAKIPRPTPKAVLIHKHPHVLTVKCYLLILNNLLFCAGTMRMAGIMNIFTDNKLHFAPYLRS